MASTVVVFDFDMTILDVDSDKWVVDEFGATDLFNSLLPTMPWNSLMDKMMNELHIQGRTIKEIVECLKRAPLDPLIISAIKSAHAQGCDLRIVSDANLLFIETILKHHEILECFTEINTNPNCVDDEGKLRIFPYHDSAHDCGLCPPNMCKGKIIETIQASSFSEGIKKQFIYIGDGNGDYCPCLKLSETDYVMPRKNFPLCDLIDSNISLLKADIHQWSNSHEFETILLKLINNNNSGSNNITELPSVENCKYRAMPRDTMMSSYETPRAATVTGN